MRVKVARVMEILIPKPMKELKILKILIKTLTKSNKLMMLKKLWKLKQKLNNYIKEDKDIPSIKLNQDIITLPMLDISTWPKPEMLLQALQMLLQLNGVRTNLIQVLRFIMMISQEVKVSVNTPEKFQKISKDQILGMINS